MQRRVALLLGLVVGFGSISACSTLGLLPGQTQKGSSDGIQRTIVTDDRSLTNLVADISPRRVIYIGETHDRYDHHLNQLAVIRGLHDRGAGFAIGVEFIQRPFQHYLDEYVAGEISEKILLKRTGYYKNWGYDFRLYRPILEYARDNGIALVALNAPSELVSQVSDNGFDGLSQQWRNQLPEMQFNADASYKRRLQRIFEMHPSSEKQFDKFLQVQILWDEYMADSAASYLQEHPGRQLVVLAGSGHVTADSTIPQRVQRKVPHEYTVLISAAAEPIGMDSVDHILLANGDQLPTAGKLGLYIGESGGEVTVRRLLHGRTAGESEQVLPGDQITSIAGEPIQSMEDFRLAMLDRLPGEQVWVELERGRTDGSQVRVSTVIELI